MTVRVIIAAVIAGAIGVAVGWWAKGNAAEEACFDAGGKWRSVDQFCVAPVWGEMQA